MVVAVAAKRWRTMVVVMIPRVVPIVSEVPRMAMMSMMTMMSMMSMMSMVFMGILMMTTVEHSKFTIFLLGSFHIYLFFSI